ncbi:MAG: hypothetical protein JWR12_1094 [Mucilaginibacter sp.]|nr:hypothetical protein [Mucilaginibacter sp.]
MRSIKITFFICLLLISASVFAHVGSPGVIYQGKAGPYMVMVSINPPDVIPGTASASVYINNQQVSHVYLQPVYWYAGDKGSPKADEALPVKGTPGQYQCLIWLMQSGVASMRVIVEGTLGKGSVIVPVMAVSTAQRTMPASLDWGLAALGILLVILMITIIGSSVTDGIVSPGINIKASPLKKYVAMAIMALVLFAILYGGSAWWNSWSSHYRRFMYKAPVAHSSILFNGKQMVLQLNIDSAWLRKNNESMSYLVPDHGKLMHLFLIREKTDDVFAHLHPVRKDSINYLANLPDLPAGRYFLFGDIVRWNGFAETITDTVNIPAKSANQITSNDTPALYSDPDDTYVISNSINDNKNPLTGKISLICGKPGTSMKLADGSTAYWQHTANAPFEANKVYPLTFAIRDSSGKPAQLQPYMGMIGHAVVMKYDGSVYVHLHPVGTYSMASQQIIQSRIKGNEKIPRLPDPVHFSDSINRLISTIRQMTENKRNTYLNAGMQGIIMAGMNGNDHDESMVTFPYAFPAPGNYRIWVQMKRNGKILNSAFDAVVE